MDSIWKSLLNEGIDKDTVQCIADTIGWLELGNPEEALSVLNKVARRYRGHARVLNTKWIVYYQMRDLENCLKVSRRLIKDYKDDALSWINHAQYAYLKKDYKKAYEIMNKVSKQFTNDAHFTYDLACYCSLTYRFQEAEYWLETARKCGNPERINEMMKVDTDFDPLREFRSQKGRRPAGKGEATEEKKE